MDHNTKYNIFCTDYIMNHDIGWYWCWRVIQAENNLLSSHYYEAQPQSNFQIAHVNLYIELFHWIRVRIDWCKHVIISRSSSSINQFLAFCIYKCSLIKCIILQSFICILSHMVWYSMIWYGLVWFGMVWYGMTWYDMIWLIYGWFIIFLVELH